MVIMDNITLINNKSNFDEDYYLDKEFEALNNEFPDCPFYISLDDSVLLTLDDPFTDYNHIYIYDYREPTNILSVYQKNNSPITLRQILLTMANSSHYKYVAELEDDHQFLESIRNISSCHFDTLFSS